MFKFISSVCVWMCVKEWLSRYSDFSFSLSFWEMWRKMVHEKWNLSGKCVCSRLRFFCFACFERWENFFLLIFLARDTNLAQRFIIDCKVFFFLWVDYWLLVFFWLSKKDWWVFFCLRYFSMIQRVVWFCLFVCFGTILCQQKWVTGSGAMVVCVCWCVLWRHEIISWRKKQSSVGFFFLFSRGVK